MGTRRTSLVYLVDGEVLFVLSFVTRALFATELCLFRQGTAIPLLLFPFHRSLELQGHLVDSLRSHSVSFEESKAIASNWVTQPFLEEDPWTLDWEDICAVEVERWNAR